ncbi:MAG: hypothetical protein ABIK28_06570 [Planctomycetota bacterium]
MSLNGNFADRGSNSRMYQAQSLLKNSIMQANVKLGKPGSKKKAGASLGGLSRLAFSGMIYVLSLIVIGALVFLYLF